MLTGLFVFSLLSGVVLATFVLSHRYLRDTSRFSELQRSATHAVARVAYELAHIRHGTLSPSAGQGFSGLSSLPRDGSGGGGAFAGADLLWQQWRVVWCDAQGELRCAGDGLGPTGMSFSQIDQSTRPPFVMLQSKVPSVTLGHHVASIEVKSEGSLASLQMLFDLGPGGAKTTYRLVSAFPLQ